MLMKKIKIVRSDGEMELCEFVDKLYTVALKANEMLKTLRIGLSTWVSEKIYDEMKTSLWIYDDIRVNAFCHYENGQNYIALSVGLLTEYWREVTEFVEQEALSVVFKISEENKPYLADTLYFYMLNFTVAHEFGHIAHGHLREINGENNIDEIFQVVGGINEEEKREKNWNTQLKEYDADSFAVAIQALLFSQNWSGNSKENLANFDRMFLANYLSFRTFAEKTGRDFTNYMTDDIEKYDHPHPGIRMYYSIILYTYWLMNFFGENKEIITIIESGSHAVIAYEKQVLKTEEFKNCYFSVAYTSKGVMHLMRLHNEWRNQVVYFNRYAYVPLVRMEGLDGMISSLDENGHFMTR